MMKFAINGRNGRWRSRYQRADDGLEDKREPIEMGKSELLYQGSEIALLAVGSMVKVAQEVYILRGKGRR